MAHSLIAEGDRIRVVRTVQGDYEVPHLIGREGVVTGKRGPHVADVHLDGDEEHQIRWFFVEELTQLPLPKEG